MSAGTFGSLRELNRLRVVDELRRHGTLSRSDIARRTGLSRSTISSLVADLKRRGFVVEHPDEPVRAAQGRPPVLLSLDPSAGAAVGVDFDHDRVIAAVSDLSRTVLAEASEPADVDNQADQALEIAARLVEQLLAEAGIEREQVLGVGVALAGPVDHARGALHDSSILPGWAGVDAAAELRERLGLTIHIDNDANLGALAEVTLGAGRQARTAAYVQISSGIGAGLIIDGLPFRGARGTAGEIGHVVVDEDGPVCRCGNRGCLETLAAGPALVRLLRDSRGEEIGTVAERIARARQGDAGARRVIADAGRYVGLMLGALCNLFNPEMVVVGGDLSAAGELLLSPLRESVERHALPFAVRDLHVVAGELGDRANVLGALALVIAQSEHAVAARIAAPQSTA
jgi:predicted NBD/HSP70 family sugar kinase/biotin operon repressor